ncbi:MAG TPA: hypothetical protein VNA25_20500 [Phycisphaerae bacterium]|nr:hypothetical protein [Phycisphaerae bacterium]
MGHTSWVAAVVLCVAGAAAAAVVDQAASPAALPLKGSIEQYGITWKFDKPVPVGQFVTGDYYVVGQVTVTAVEPGQAGSGKAFRNGSMLNPPTTTSHAYDGRMRGFDPKLAATFPLKLKPGDTLVSAVSLDETQQNQVLPNPTKPRETSPIQKAAVLTCLAAPVPTDAFRPSYCDQKKDKIHRAKDVKWDLLPKVEPVRAKAPYWADRSKLNPLKLEDGVPPLAWAERMFERPWIDHVYGWTSRETHPSENMPGYGREVGSAVSYAALLLCCDFPVEKKKTLGLRLIQVGIDNWAVAKRSKKGSAGGWPAAGGFGNGRKLPIVFAAIMLDDPEMKEIRKHAGEASFGEDEHVEFGKSWTGAIVRFTGQYPLIGHRQKDRGPYEHLPPDQWPGGNKTMSEGYRRCCTSVCWVGQALAMRMMKAEKVWDHDAFFVYVDRWMYQDDTEARKAIKEAHGRDMSPAQGSAYFDPWIDAMWAKYRTILKAPTDGWKPK